MAKLSVGYIYIVLFSTGLAGPNEPKWRWGFYLQDVPFVHERDLTSKGVLHDINGGPQQGYRYSPRRYTPLGSNKLYCALDVGCLTQDQVGRFETICRSVYCCPSPVSTSVFTCRIWTKSVVQRLHHLQIVQCPNIELFEQECASYAKQHIAGNCAFYIGLRSIQPKEPIGQTAEAPVIPHRSVTAPPASSSRQAASLLSPQAIGAGPPAARMDTSARHPTYRMDLDIPTPTPRMSVPMEIDPPAAGVGSRRGRESLPTRMDTDLLPPLGPARGFYQPAPAPQGRFAEARPPVGLHSAPANAAPAAGGNAAALRAAAQAGQRPYAVVQQAAYPPQVARPPAGDAARYLQAQGSPGQPNVARPAYPAYTANPAQVLIPRPGPIPAQPQAGQARLPATPQAGPSRLLAVPQAGPPRLPATPRAGHPRV